MKVCGISIFGLAAVVCATAVSQQRKPLLLVANQGDASVSIVEPGSNKVLATVKEDVPEMFGHEVAVSADGKLAYVPLYSNVGLGKPGTDGDRILVLDIAKGAFVNKIQFDHGVRPHDPVLDRVNGKLYVTTELNKAITIIDPKTLAIMGSITTDAEHSHMLVLSHDGHWGYTANVSSGTVSVLDLRAGKFVRKIPVAATVQRIAISPDDKTVVTSDQGAPRLAFLDTKTSTVRDWMPLPSVGYGAAFSHDGKWLLLTMPATGQLAVIDPLAKRVVHVMDVGPHPQEVLIAPDGHHAYVSCLGADFVSVVDLATWKVTGKITTGNKADGMAWVAR